MLNIELSGGKTLLQADAFKKPNMIDEARMETYLSAVRKERKNLAENVSKD